MENKKLIILTNLDDKVKEQLNNVYHHPKCVGKTIAFPDCHYGKGIPIGTLAILKDAISPNMVGADIGCGIISLKYAIKKDFFTTDEWKQICGEIRKQIPMGFASRKTLEPIETFKYYPKDAKFFQQHIIEAQKQYGTLGGGNHFIEFDYDDEYHVWLNIHTGSRHIGKITGDFYNKIANEKCKDKYPQLIKQELAFLEGKDKDDYLKDMYACMQFAKDNRMEIAQIITKIIGDFMKRKIETIYEDDEYNICDRASWYELVDKHFQTIHNYAQQKGDYYIHRKGCVNFLYEAPKEQLDELNEFTVWGFPALIAGSCGTGSYVVVPKLTAKDLYWTCSHGAGRVLGRKQAIKTLDLQKEKDFLDKQNIIHSLRGKDNLDEATGAYKNIDDIIKKQLKNIEVADKLKPFIVIKG